MPPCLPLETNFFPKFVRTYGTSMHHVNYHSHNYIVPPLIKFLLGYVTLIHYGNCLTKGYMLMVQMARTKQTAHKSTGGRAPRHQLAPRTRQCHMFLGEFGMPTLCGECSAMQAILMEWSPATSGRMSSWEKVSQLLWRPLFIPEVTILSGQVGVMSQLAGLLKKQLAGKASSIFTDLNPDFMCFVIFISPVQQLLNL